MSKILRIDSYQDRLRKALYTEPTLALHRLSKLYPVQKLRTPKRKSSMAHKIRRTQARESNSRPNHTLFSGSVTESRDLNDMGAYQVFQPRGRTRLPAHEEGKTIPNNIVLLIQLSHSSAPGSCIKSSGYCTKQKTLRKIQAAQEPYKSSFWGKINVVAKWLLAPQTSTEHCQICPELSIVFEINDLRTLTEVISKPNQPSKSVAKTTDSFIVLLLLQQSKKYL